MAMFTSYFDIARRFFFWGDWMGTSWTYTLLWRNLTWLLKFSFQFFSHEKVLDMYQAVGSRKFSLTVIWSYYGFEFVFSQKNVVVSSPIGWNNWKIIPQSPSCRNLASRPPITPSSTPWVRQQSVGTARARAGTARDFAIKDGGMKNICKTWFMTVNHISELDG